MIVETVEAEGLPEGLYAEGLAEIAQAHGGRLHRLLSLLHGQRASATRSSCVGKDRGCSSPRRSPPSEPSSPACKGDRTPV